MFRIIKSTQLFGAALQTVPSFKPLLEQPSQYSRDGMKHPFIFLIYPNEKDPAIFMHIEKLQTEPAETMIS